MHIIYLHLVLLMGLQTALKNVIINFENILKILRVNWSLLYMGKIILGTGLLMIAAVYCLSAVTIWKTWDVKK